MAKKTTLSYSDAIAELETIVNKLQNNEYEIDELTNARHARSNY